MAMMGSANQVFSYRTLSRWRGVKHGSIRAAATGNIEPSIEPSPPVTCPPGTREADLAATLDSLLDRPLLGLTSSYPVAAEWRGEEWVGEPAWNAPEMPDAPIPRLENWRGHGSWLYDFHRFFQNQMGVPYRATSPQMRLRQIVLRGRAARAGRLLIWADDMAVVRRNGLVTGEKRAPGNGGLMIDVASGDEIEIACAQLAGEWWLSVGFERPVLSDQDRIDLLRPWSVLAGERLRQPDGPPLKLYTNARNPSLMASSLLTMVVNGYSPEEVLLYGDYQWSPEKRAMVEALLPFARIVPAAETCRRLEELGGPELPELARAHWWVMKSAITLLENPASACMMDDDLLILEPLTDALSASRTHALVHVQDRKDWASRYRGVWSHALSLPDPLPTGLVNCGLVFIRQMHDRQQVARMMVEYSPARIQAMVDFDIRKWCWEQGLVAALYAEQPVFPLDLQRHLFVPHDGLPYGPLAYDYERNPAGYSSVHLVNRGYEDDSETLGFAVGQRALRRVLLREP
jgi:hypothetical protein